MRGMLAAIADERRTWTGCSPRRVVPATGRPSWWRWTRLARRAETQGDRAAATRLLAEADELHAGLGHLVDEADRTDARWVRERVRAVDRERPSSIAVSGKTRTVNMPAATTTD